jgi:hypothetical protein
MNALEAEDITGLTARENKGDLHNEWLRCLLGEWEIVCVKTSAFREVPEKVFRLVAFGASWENAVAMWEKMQKKEMSA